MFRLVILTFHGEARDPHKFEHAHESPFVMAAPLVILAALSVFIWYTPNPIAPDEGMLLKNWIKTPTQVTPVETRFDFMKPSSASEIKEVQGEITHSVEYTETMHWAHYPALFISLVMAGFGMLLAFIFYQWKKVNADKLAEKIKMLYNFSLNKWYLDEAYDKTAVAGTLGISGILNWFDINIVDAIVNGSAYVTRFISKLSGLFDTYVVDGFVNFSAFFSGFLGLAFRRLQTGKIQTYIVIVVFAVIILLLVFKPF
jgi:NADH-quinone oxidoreductase subunit L